MVRGSPADQERAVARALELGINYFDTAPSYGNGESERNLGRVLKALRPDILVGHQVPDRADRARPDRRSGDRLAGGESPAAGGWSGSISSSSTIRSRRMFAAAASMPGRCSIAFVPALEGLRRQGKIRFFGITALGLGDTAASTA